LSAHFSAIDMDEFKSLKEGRDIYFTVTQGSMVSVQNHAYD